MPPRKTPAKKSTTRTSADDVLYCSCCGTAFPSPDKSFYKSPSPLYAKNGGYVHICKNCIRKYYDELMQDPDMTVDNGINIICSILGLYYSEEKCASAKKSAGKSVGHMVAAYMGVISKQTKTYIDTIKENAIELRKHASFKSEKETGLDEKLLERLGRKFSPDELDIYEETYSTLIPQVTPGDLVQESMVLDLCEIKALQAKALKKGETDEYTKLWKLYQDGLKNANLNVKINNADGLNDSDMCWGNFIKMIEDYTPAEIYKDKGLFADVSGIKDYVVRFILRPIKNFFGGTSEMDPEFSINPDGGDDNVE